MNHILKITPNHFEEVLNDRKTFEVRKNDRNFAIGDTVELKEFLDYEAFPECSYIVGPCSVRHSKGESCPLNRECCESYLAPIYTQRSVKVIITDIFDISDVIPECVAFNFSKDIDRAGQLQLLQKSGYTKKSLRWISNMIPDNLGNSKEDRMLKNIKFHCTDGANLIEALCKEIKYLEDKNFELLKANNRQCRKK